ncbi:uncharacterized protein LOC111718463 isoform X2 [Eurytemora carolleeae]|uniref:uncharacterized protein LOC111718463 isoform X2 n=1 Tax=Eurytemora carolleeae TaxID=1294199 RepID=UPI000C75779D|nr:uncharacterized protein LOC111718463 isoform X2 [Eurytemora carolleeae]|eukprot:XP_023349837.1 uncharacterized protein LOC111718463 isoform X2 [Eurytemora affinis]
MNFNKKKMGGDAFPNTERLDEAEYARITQMISAYLSDIDCKVAIPVEISDKDDLCRKRGKSRPYGDVDVIVGNQEGTDRMKIASGISDLLESSSDLLCNDKTISFLTKERYQVDLLFCSPEHVETLSAFKSNNDFGALLGHLLTPLEMKWSEKGLAIRLQINKLSGIGTFKSDFICSDQTRDICEFLGIPFSSLDGKTRMSSSEIFEILTSSRAYLPNQYSQKYKIKERRKRRPLSDDFFTRLEESEVDLETRNKERFQDDIIFLTFVKYTEGDIGYLDLIQFISGRFGKLEELNSQIKLISEQNNPKSDEKFGHHILKLWFPEIDHQNLGGLMNRVKKKFVAK